jgi:hypothetical protein
MNGSNPTQVDWTGFCVCDLNGGCSRFGTLPDGSATINEGVNVTLYSQTGK